MERDALIAHGTSFLLQDRLMNCSDYSTAWVCRTCGSLISLGYEDISLGEDILRSSGSHGPGGEYCRVCRIVAEEKDERERSGLANGEQLVHLTDNGSISICIQVRSSPSSLNHERLMSSSLSVAWIPTVLEVYRLE